MTDRFYDRNGELRLEGQLDAGGGPYLPIANPAGVTVDTTTYADVIKGSGKLTTIVFPAGGDQGALAIALAGDAFPRWVFSADPVNEGLLMSDGTISPLATNAFLAVTHAGYLAIADAGQAGAPTTLRQVSPLFTITSGALPTVDFTGKSGMGQQVEATRDVDIYVETGTAGSVVAALSPDNMTYTTIYTKTVALTDVCHARVPATWYLKLTATTAVLGVGTYA